MADCLFSPRRSCFLGKIKIHHPPWVPVLGIVWVCCYYIVHQITRSCIRCKLCGWGHAPVCGCVCAEGMHRWVWGWLFYLFECGWQYYCATCLIVLYVDPFFASLDPQNLLEGNLQSTLNLGPQTLCELTSIDLLLLYSKQRIVYFTAADVLNKASYLKTLHCRLVWTTTCKRHLGWDELYIQVETISAEFNWDSEARDIHKASGDDGDCSTLGRPHSVMYCIEKM